MEKRKLMRSQRDKYLGGVCGGVADYLNADPTLIRLLFVLFAIFGGPGILLYLILWIALPEETAVA